MPNQYEVPLFAAFGNPKDEPAAWIRAATFEDCVRLTFERARARFDMRTFARHVGIHAPHVNDVAAGKRPLKAEKVDRACFLSGCNACRQWLDMRREDLAFEADAIAKELVWQQLRKAAA